MEYFHSCRRPTVEHLRSFRAQELPLCITSSFGIGSPSGENVLIKIYYKYIFITSQFANIHRFTFIY